MIQDERNDEKRNGPFHQGLVDELGSLVATDDRTRKLRDFLGSDHRVSTLITHGNTLVVGRLNYNDHGLTHSRITSINSLKILELLRKGGITSTIENELWGDHIDARVAVLGGAYLHDIGNAVHRTGHHLHAGYLAAPILDDALVDIYPPERAERMRASILECIYSHDESVRCLSIEAGCVTAGDGADMANGRARIPFSLGKMDIHSVSALSIKAVKIKKGAEKPVRIDVVMTESAGVFQIQEVLGRKLGSSDIAKYIEVVAKVVDEKDNVIERIEF